jgi:hypothetical protein
MVADELTEVVTLVSPVVQPVGSFALSVVGTVTGPVVSEVEGLVSELTSIVGALLDPVYGLIASL